jgi:subtilisin family serine protease
MGRTLIMKRWGILGVLVLAAACGGEDDRISAQAHLCPGVVAGGLPGAELSQSAAPRPGAGNDGRRRYLIRFRDEESVSASRVSELGSRVIHVYRHAPAIAAQLTPEEYALLRWDPDVKYIEPDVMRRPFGVTALTTEAPPSTPAGSAGEYTPGIDLVKAPWVWDQNRNGTLDKQEPDLPTQEPYGEGIKVCVLDTGIDPNHPELRDAIDGRHDIVDGDEDPSDQDANGVWGEGHGTHVAGTIAAQLGSGGSVSPNMDEKGVAGVAPGARLLIARVLNTQGMAWASDIIKGLEWCQQQGAQIASLSLGGGSDSRQEREAFQKAADNGMLVIAAAGNSGGPLDFPAAYRSVLAVGAVDQSMRRAPFSAHGFSLSLMAPGVDVLSTVIQGQGTMSELEVGDIPYESRPVFLAPAGKISGRLVDCGVGDSIGSCQTGSCDGFVAYVDRSLSVPLQIQLANVMRQGAGAVIFGDMPHEGMPASLTIGRRGNWVPAIVVSDETAGAMRKMMGFNTHVRLHATDYALSSGTSMAAPHVAGVAAIVWSKRPTLSSTQVRALLESTAKDLGPDGKDYDYGYGLVQANAAIHALDASE